MKRTVILFALLVAAAAAEAQGPDTVFLDELTWMEVRDRMENGTDTVIVASAGTEQNGPHMVLGKHKFIIRRTSELIARELGNALVAPIITYVPEGSLDPPTGHMRYPGAITLPNEYFKKICEYAARSMKVHGFKTIVFIGDSGGNQRGMEEVANALNEEWRGSATHVYFLPDYYSNNGFRDWLVSQGEKPEDIGSHAGITDTSQVLAVNPEHIRMDKRADRGGFEGSGVSGNPTHASVEYGKKGIELKVQAAIRQLKELMAAASTDDR